MNALARLLFLNGFCVNAPRCFLEKDEQIPSNVIDRRFLWCSGFGAAAASPCPSLPFMFANRSKVLNCLLLCFAGSLSKTIDEYLRQEPPWLAVFTAGHSPYTANLFCSLLSSIFTYDPVGYGLPLSRLFAAPEPEAFVCAALQLLLLLLDFKPLVFSEVAAGAGNTPALVNSLLTSLCNISPFIKGFGFESCIRLLGLLERLAKPSWLFKAPFHCQDLLFLIDAFNNLLQYQYEKSFCLWSN
ncbi:GI18945, related [Eimeria tenella]|uniref:GI18945, related n=1 Tax=Eimeria tenella TaxID=5802 RepID=U6KRV4_EIMTE|nr:GI18945, related [Eimeria tenella]CDJ40701.1 GI18945, related [Eimeria tenella]|eukprot:XP_013231451.1 GI18945, related [Eimeria tenella]